MNLFKIPYLLSVLLIAVFLQTSACAKEPVQSVPAEAVNTMDAGLLSAATHDPAQKVFVNSSPVNSADEAVIQETSSVGMPQKNKIPANAVPVLEELTPAAEMLNLAQYKGKVIYLDFWASWCKPCQWSFPWMQAMQTKFQDDLVIVAVNLDEDLEKAEAFLERYDVNFEIVYDPLWQAGREYGIYGLPFSFVYNRAGELVGKHGGFKEGDNVNLENALQNLINLGE